MRSSADPAKVKFYRIVVEGPWLIRSAWTEGRRPRETVTRPHHRAQTLSRRG